MIKRKSGPYNLENRTYEFAKNVRVFLKTLDYSISNNEDAKQLARSSASIGANYIEANESLSPKDFIYRIKISRKEAKESSFWLRLLKDSNSNIDAEFLNYLIQESRELRLILSSIIKNKEKITN